MTAENRRGTAKVLLFAAACCMVMTVIDGVVRPAYAVKSAVKIGLFFLLPLLLFRRKMPGALFRPHKRGLLAALGLGLAVYGVILAAYFAISGLGLYDFSGIVGQLSQNAGVTRENFLLVSLYISFVNSLLEEFFFRGFLFANLKATAGRSPAYLGSSLLFALYHVAMMSGWFSPVLFLLAMAGLAVGGAIFNWLNERYDTLLVSWLVHMFANFAINTVGFLLMA